MKSLQEESYSTKTMTSTQKEKYLKEIKKNLAKNQTLIGNIEEIIKKDVNSSSSHPKKCPYCKGEEITKVYIPYHIEEVSESGLKLGPFWEEYPVRYICRNEECKKRIKIGKI